MNLWVPSVFCLKKMGEIYSTGSCSHSTTTPFLRSYLPPLESKADFLEFQILNTVLVKEFPQILVSSLEQSKAHLGLK